MIKAKSIGKVVIAMISNKLYQKEFDTIEEMKEVYEKLLNVDESSWDEIDEVKKLFSAPPTEAEVQLKLEFEKKKEESKKLEDILDFMKEVKVKL